MHNDRAAQFWTRFEQRLKDLQENRVNTTVSLIGQAGARWVGDVPLNLENINDVGLIEVYETILKRGRMLSEGLPNARTEMFEGASHFFLMEQPERFNRLLLEWLQRHARAAA